MRTCIWKRRATDVPVKSAYELVTLASIVEKETGRADERPHVASVFANRLGKRMKLQSDPTIIYGVCHQVPARCRDGRLVDAAGSPRLIRHSEIDLNTGYNTYRIDRLPPTPISNPGRLALEAVAHPADSNAAFEAVRSELQGCGGFRSLSGMGIHSWARGSYLCLSQHEVATADHFASPKPWGI